MAGGWDNALKFLVQEKPQDFVSWLMGKGQWEKEVSGELKARHIHADVLYQVQVNKNSCLLHIEFQRYGDPDMARRMWEYNVRVGNTAVFSARLFVCYILTERGQYCRFTLCSSEFRGRSNSYLPFPSHQTLGDTNRTITGLWL